MMVWHIYSRRGGRVYHIDSRLGLQVAYCSILLMYLLCIQRPDAVLVVYPLPPNSFHSRPIVIANLQELCTLNADIAMQVFEAFGAE